jgi:hypothetical protein
MPATVTDKYIIGAIYLYSDKWIVFTAGHGSTGKRLMSEIGLFEEDVCKYREIVQDSCLNFDKRYLISGSSRQKEDCSWQVYWADGFNPDRFLNVGDPQTWPTSDYVWLGGGSGSTTVNFYSNGNGTNIPIINCSGNSTGSGDTTYQVYSTSSSNFRFYVTYAGVVNAVTTTIAGISDQRLKENVRPLELGLAEVLSLQPRRYDWIEGKGQNKKDAVGFIAQEFEVVLPNSVGTSKAGEDGIEYKNINYEELMPTLVKAIQEQQALITQLQADVATLKGTP